MSKFKTIASALFLAITINVYGQNIGLFSFQRTYDESWTWRTSFSGFHVTRTNVFVLEQLKNDSNNFTLLLHVYNKDGSLLFNTEPSISGHTLAEGNQSTWLYGNDNYVLIYAQHLTENRNIDSSAIIFYTDNGNISYDIRTPYIRSSVPYLSPNGHLSCFGIEGDWSGAHFLKFNNKGKTLKDTTGPINFHPSAMAKIGYKYRGIAMSNRNFYLSKDGVLERQIGFKLKGFDPLFSNTSFIQDFEVTADSSLLIIYPYKDRIAPKDSQVSALAKIDTNGTVQWCLGTPLSYGEMIDAEPLRNGEIAIFTRYPKIFWINQKGEHLRNVTLDIKKDYINNLSPYKIIEDPVDSSLWLTFSMEIWNETDTFLQMVVAHLDAKGLALDSNQNIIATRLKQNLIKPQNTVEFYPNPAENFLTIELPNQTKNAVEIVFTDIVGNKYKFLIASKKSSIDVSNLKPGYYMVTSNSNELNFCQTVIIN